MVSVVSLVVIGNVKSLQPDLQVAVERDRDMGRPEGRHDLEPCRLQHRRPIQPKEREPLKLITGKVVDIGVAAGVETRQAPAIPVRIAATELLGLQLRGTLDEVITAHHDQRVGREWRSADARYTFGNAVSIASVTDSQGMARRGRRLTSERKP